MKILLVNQVFYPDAAATAQYLSDLAIELRKSGHEVTALASRRQYFSPYLPYAAHENYQSIQIIRVWPFTFGRNTKISRILDALFLNLAFFVKLLQLQKFDCVVALTSPPLVAWAACWVSKWRKSRFIYWVMDMNPDEAIAMGWLKKNSLTSQILETASRWTFKNSERIIALDKSMQSRIVAKGIDAAKIAVIPPWSHDEDLRPVTHEQNPFRKQYHLENKTVVMYSGNHSICHPLDTILEAARMLKEDGRIAFLFIGGGARFKDVSEFKTKYGLTNIVQLAYQPRSEMKFSLSAADVHLVVMGEAMSGIVHPCKIYGILTVGRPFVYVGPAHSHVVDLIHEGAAGYAVQHGEVQKLTAIIRQNQKASQVETEAMRVKNQTIAGRFSAKVLMQKMVGEITGVLE